MAEANERSIGYDDARMDSPALQIVRCYHCRGMMKVSAKALSVFCPHCQKRVNLENLNIVGTHPGKTLMTCGDIVIQQTARLQVQVFGRNVTVLGWIKGGIQAIDAIEVGPTGHVIGDIRARKIMVRDGGKIEGNCEILPPDAHLRLDAATSPLEAPQEDSQEVEAPAPVLTGHRPRPLPLPNRNVSEALDG